MIAAVTFSSAPAAGRRIAGVAAAARIVRELAEVGFEEAWLELPPGEGLSWGAVGDIERLAGSMVLHFGAAPANLGVATFPGDRLILASAIPGFLAGHPGASKSVLRLDDPDASMKILRGTRKASDGLISRLLNRSISQRLSAALLALPGFRPDHATAGTALLAALMFAMLLSGGEMGVIAGGLLFQAASIFDGVDGEIARATFRCSRRGAFLDTLVDVATNFLFIAGLTFNLGARGDMEAVLLGGWGLSLFVFGQAIVGYRALQAEGTFTLDLVKHDYRERFSGSAASRLVDFFIIITSRDAFAFALAVVMVVGFPVFGLWLFAVSTSAWFLFVLGSLFSRRALPATSKA